MTRFGAGEPFSARQRAACCCCDSGQMIVSGVIGGGVLVVSNISAVSDVGDFSGVGGTGDG